MIQIPIESMNLMMLNVGYATHHADWNWQKVSSPFIRIFYIMEGEAMLHLPDKDVRLKPGYMYIKGTCISYQLLSFIRMSVMGYSNCIIFTCMKDLRMKWVCRRR